MPETKWFCSSCNGIDFCLPACEATPARVKYLQRTAYAASVMLALASNDEQRRYWSAQLAKTETREAAA